MKALSSGKKEIERKTTFETSVPKSCQPEDHVKDEEIIEMLSSVIENIKNGVYSQEEKDSIYSYAKHYNNKDREEDFDVQAARDLIKNYVAGWWICSVYENANSTEEKLIPQKTCIEDKQ